MRAEAVVYSFSTDAGARGASGLEAKRVCWLSRSRTKAPEKPPAWPISRVSLACSVGVEIADAAPAGRTARAATREMTRARTRERMQRDRRTPHVTESRAGGTVRHPWGRSSTW